VDSGTIACIREFSINSKLPRGCDGSSSSDIVMFGSDISHSSYTQMEETEMEARRRMKISSRNSVNINLL
jgi:hypothetical protein